MVVPRVQAAIASAFGEEYRGTDPVVRPSQFADIQINAAMALAKKVGMPPRDAAARIVDALDLDGICTAVEISGPGFINLTFDGTWIEELLNAESAGAPAVPAAESQRVVVDYSSPNVAKEMHVGHLRTTVVGDSLVKVFEALGDTVIRQNHIGDWGTPFGMLIEHWLEIGEDSPEAALLVDDPSAFYQAARAKFDASATDEDGFATRARLRVVALQGGDAETFAVWQRLVAQSKRYFNAIYSMLGISLTDDHIAGESSYDAHLAQLCQELEERGLARISDGALCTFPAGFTGRDGQPMPLIIRKSDGGYGYGTTDLATIRYRVRELEANRVLYVVGAPQNMHLRMVMATARDAGWLPDTVEAVHVQIGNVLGEDGKILKSRSGAPVKLMALLEEAVDRARAVIDASRPELTEAERAATARQVGIGAVKYADLSVGHDTEYVFDFDRMLALSGNTGPYVQYAAARIRSILRKAGVLEQQVAAERSGSGHRGKKAAGRSRRDRQRRRHAGDGDRRRRTRRTRPGPAPPRIRRHAVQGARNAGAAPAVHVPVRTRPALHVLLRPVPRAEIRGLGAGVAARPVRAGPAPAVRGPGPAWHRDPGEHVSQGRGDGGDAPGAGELTALDSARIAVAALLLEGVRYVVVSPGSRSAPMAYALAEADAAGRVELLVRIDERDAGFTALGLALASGAPAAVLTTSGTAVGNLLPAVMEANHAAVPLVVISADRPVELRGTGANQTTVQLDLFGEHVRFAVDVPAGSDPRRAVETALSAATGAFEDTPPGPVQLNLAFRDPLVPAPGDRLPPESGRRVYRAPRGPLALDFPPASPGLPERRTVVLAGHDAGPVAEAFARAHGLPLLAEPSSNARFGPNAVGPYRILSWTLSAPNPRSRSSAWCSSAGPPFPGP